MTFLSNTPVRTPKTPQTPQTLQTPQTPQTPQTSSISLSSIDSDSLAKAIARFEGANVKGSLAQRNLNPGNLKFHNQPGSVQGEKGFAKFKSIEEGYSALNRQIAKDTGRGMTLKQFTYKYAPPSENKTENYYKFLRKNVKLTT